MITYPYPPHSGSATSKAAAASKISTAATERERVLDFLVARGVLGATDDEMQIALGMEGNTQRPRRWELEEAGQVLDSGMTRQTSKHRSAKVWLAHQFSDAAIPVKETKTQRYERVLRTIRDVCECCEGLETIAVDRIRGLCEEAL